MRVADRPILFQDRLVRAILAGRKTQTRRIVNPQPIHLSKAAYAADEMRLPGVPGIWSPCDATHTRVKCPYGEPGDRLYVREAFTVGTLGIPKGVTYRATDPEGRTKEDTIWKSSIHMPRAAARILLDVADIRLERLQAISAEDAIAEGVMTLQPGSGWAGAQADLARGPTRHDTPRLAFASLWDSINARPKPIKENGVVSHYVSYPWDGEQETRTYRGEPWSIEPNPWVWCVTFPPWVPPQMTGEEVVI